MNNKIDQAQIIRLQYERQNLQNAIKDFTKLYDNLSDKKLRKEVNNKIELISNRLTELDRVCSILRIKLWS